MSVPLPRYRVMVGKHPYYGDVSGEWALAAVYYAAVADYGIEAVSFIKLNDGQVRSEVK